MVMATSSVVFEQPGAEMVQRNVYTPFPPEGVKVALFAFTLLNCEVLVLGLPATTDQVPVAVPVAAFAASVTAALEHEV